MSVQEHQQAGAGLGPLEAAVLTISDTRDEATDQSGQVLIELLSAAGHTIAAYQIVPDDADAIRSAIAQLPPQVDLIITTGGTGMSPRDVTIETCRPLFSRELEGFGDLFRLLSFEEVGPAAMLSRATGGSVGRAMLFCLPGSRAAVRLAAERLILPEIKHLLSQIRKR